MAETELAQPGCIMKASKRRAFARALRTEIDGKAVEALFATPCEHARMGTIDGAARNGLAGLDKEKD